MKVLKKRIFIITVFIIASVIASFLFYQLNISRKKSDIKNAKRNFSLVTELTADTISFGYFQWDDMYYAIINNDQEQIKEWFNDIYELSHYVEDIKIIDAKPVFTGDYYSMIGNKDDFAIDFVVYDSLSENHIPDKYIKIKLNARLIINEIQDPFSIDFSDSIIGENFVYDLYVVSLQPPFYLFQIISALSFGLLIAIGFERITTRHSHFFYESRGLEKIIFLFEKTEEYSANHSRKVADITTFIGKKYGFKGRHIKDLRIAALLHDIGKISVPVEILNKKEALNKDEFGVIKKHVAYSANIIDNFEELAHLREIILYHHEKIDGSGYPIGLKGEQIPIESRIISIADIFEALTGRRPYRDPIEPEKAIILMKDMPIDQDILKIMDKNLEEVMKLISIYNTE